MPSPLRRGPCRPIAPCSREWTPFATAPTTTPARPRPAWPPACPSRAWRHVCGERAGLWLKVQNRTSQTLSGDLGGAMVRPQGIKTVDMDCGALDLQEIGQAELSASSDCAFHLLFEKIFGKRLKIHAGFGDGPKRSLAVRVDRLEGEIKLVWKRGKWRRGVGPPAADESGFSLVWQGMDPSIETPEALAEELRRQLESLGYR